MIAPLNSSQMINIDAVENSLGSGPKRSHTQVDKASHADQGIVRERRLFLQSFPECRTSIGIRSRARRLIGPC